MRAMRRMIVLIVLGVAAAVPATGAAAQISATEVTSMATLTGVSCAGSGPCYAVGLDPSGNPAVVDVSGGSAGAVSDFADTSFQPLGIACWPAGGCLAVGNTVDPTSGAQVGAMAPLTNGTPGATAEVTNAATLSAVSCGSAGFCVAAGQDQSGAPGTSTYSAAGPQAFTDFADTAFVPQGVGCAGQGCLVAGQDPTATDSVGALATVTPSNQGSVADTTTASSLAGAACPATGPCVAGGYLDSGTDSSGSPQTLPVLSAVSSGAAKTSFTYSGESDGVFTDVACSPGQTCLAIGTDGGGDTIAAPFIDGGAGAVQTDETPESIGGIQPTGLACPSASSCVAIGTDAASNPVLATIPVPAFTALGSTGGSGGSGGGSSPPKHARPTARHRVPTRLLTAITWRQPVRRLLISVRCQTATRHAGIAGLRVALESRPRGSHHAWRVLGSALTRKVGANRGEARFVVPARRGPGTEYRAVVAATRAYGGSVSSVKTVIIT